MRHAVIEVIKRNEDFLLIKDLGPWDRHPTITNDAEWVVSILMEMNKLFIHQRLFYFDSEGQESELVFGPDGFIRFEAGTHKEIT